MNRTEYSLFSEGRGVAVGLVKMDLLFVLCPFFVASFLWDSEDVSACLNRAM